MGRRAATKATSEKEMNDLSKLVFCAALAEGATIGEAAAEAGVHRKTVYRWHMDDQEFAAAWDDGLEAGTEVLEAEARRRAVHGVEEPVIYQGQMQPLWELNADGTPKMIDVDEPNEQGVMVKVRKPVQARDGKGNPKFLTIRKPSDTLMIFMLKARRPDTYRERATFEHTGKGGKDLPPPAPMPAGVLIVPGLMADTAAWAAMAQQTAIKAGG